MWKVDPGSPPQVVLKATFTLRCWTLALHPYSDLRMTLLPHQHSGGVTDVRDPQTGLPKRLVEVTKDTSATKTHTHVTKFMGRLVGSILIARAPAPQHPEGEGVPCVP